MARQTRARSFCLFGYVNYARWLLESLSPNYFRRIKKTGGINYGNSIYVLSPIFYIYFSDFWKEAKKKFNLPGAFMVNVSGCDPSVISDDKQGGLLAARHLIAKGCKKLVHISGNLSYYKEADDRTYAFVEEAKRWNVDCYVYQNTIDITKLEELQKLVNKVFYEQPDMDGMFLSNDILAAQCIAFALSQGLRIPDDLRIIGYDDIYISSLIYPPLTTIRQNYRVLAETALENVLAQINGEKVDDVTVVPVELIERKTT